MVSAIDNRGYEDEAFDLFELAARLWRGRLIIIACMVCLTALFGAAAFLMTPVYRASAVLVPATADPSGSLGKALGSLGGLAAIAGIDIGGKGATNTAESLAVLRSREFTESFIVEQNMMPVLYASKWNTATNDWGVAPEKRPSLAQGYKFFDKIRTANEDKKTGLIRVQIEWKDREQAAAWVNALIARLNTVMRARAIQRTQAYIGFLEKELETTSAIETRHAISRIMESQINERMLANVTEEYAFRVVDRALAPDPRDPVRPKKALMIAAGMIAGLVVGAVTVLVLSAIRARRAPAS